MRRQSNGQSWNVVSSKIGVGPSYNWGQYWTDPTEKRIQNWDGYLLSRGKPIKWVILTSVMRILLMKQGMQTIKSGANQKQYTIPNATGLSHVNPARLEFHRWIDRIHYEYHQHLSFLGIVRKLRIRCPRFFPGISMIFIHFPMFLWYFQHLNCHIRRSFFGGKGPDRFADGLCQAGNFEREKMVI